MAEFPAPFAASFVEYTGLGADVNTSVTASGSANTKGSYAEIHASCPFNVGWLVVNLTKDNTALVADWLLDIAVGAAGSEVVVWPNLLISTGGINEWAVTELVPLRIKKGERIAVRAQCSDGSSPVIRVGLGLVEDGGFFSGSPLSRVTAYGPNTADSGGVQVDPGAGAGFGSWVELSSAIADPMRWMLVSLGSRNGPGYTSPNFAGKVQIGVGAGGSEQVIVDSIPYKNGGPTQQVHLPGHSFPISVKSGQRLAARAASNETDATDRLLDVAVYGVG